ncbi:MAG: hypothetical protein ACR2NB_00625 [Solirubrobacteraceae bacterium]
MTCRLLVLSLALAAASVPPAHAASTTVGSDLTADATIPVSNPNDWGAWNTRLASGGAVLSPVQGEINAVRLKGRINPSTVTSRLPDVVLHVQVLRPQLGGSVKAIVTSENLELPFGGDPNRISTYGREQLTKPDTRLCIQKGDYVAMATSGGFGGPQNGYPEGSYPNGPEFQMFARVPGSVVDVFKGTAGFANGDGSVFRGTPGADAELLLQATIGSGADARYSCQTPAEQSGATGPGGSTGSAGSPAASVAPVTIPQPKRRSTVRAGGSVKIPVFCHLAAGCSGTLKLIRGTRTVAQGHFTAAKGSAFPRVKLNGSARRTLRRSGTLKVTAKVTVNGVGNRRTLRLKAA